MNLRTSAVRLGLLPAGIAIALTPAFAAAQESTTTLDRIEITGSRIRSADVETQQPILTLDRQALEKQGLTSVADVLQNLTSAGSPAISRADALSSGEDVGGYYVDLRNLGAQRTLVLVNGKRLGASTSGLQDLSQIPMAAIERIEVLKDGASSIYGSDAIAGVVNVITRKRFDGAGSQRAVRPVRPGRRRYHPVLLHCGYAGRAWWCDAVGRILQAGSGVRQEPLVQPRRFAWSQLDPEQLEPDQPERFVVQPAAGRLR